jgi:hypothetical protein
VTIFIILHFLGGLHILFSKISERTHFRLWNSQSVYNKCGAKAGVAEVHKPMGLAEMQ